LDCNGATIGTLFQILNWDLNKTTSWFNTINLIWVKIGSMNFFIQWNILRINVLGFEFNWHHHQNS